MPSCLTLKEPSGFHDGAARHGSGAGRFRAASQREGDDKAVSEVGDKSAPNAGFREEFIRFDEFRTGRFPLLGWGVYTEFPLHCLCR